MINPVRGIAVRIVDEAYWTVPEALVDFDVTMAELEAWGYDVDGLDAALPWLQRITGCPL